LGKADKGLVRRGRSRAQLTRLIGRWEVEGKPRLGNNRRPRIALRYSVADVELLAEVDEAHETLSGPAEQGSD